jgi:WD40 repeat protein
LSYAIWSPGGVTLFAWSPSGSKIAASANEGLHSWSVRILNISTQEILRLDLSGRLLQLFEWSPDETLLASATEEDRHHFDPFPGTTVIQIWSLAHGRCLLTFRLETKITSMSWSDDSTWLRLGYLCVKAGALSTVSRQDSAAIGVEGASSIALSYDGIRQASFSDRSIKVWHIAKNQCLYELQLELCQWIEFDSSDSSMLHTSVGTFWFAHDDGKRLHAVNNSDSEESGSRQVGYGINSDRSWITFEGQDLLWLPPEYRPANPDLFAMSGNTAAIGCFSGHVMILKFSGMNPIQSLATSTRQVPLRGLA